MATTPPYNPDAFNTPNIEVSPLPVSTLFPGKTVKTIAWPELWFGSSSHLDPGYKSDDPATVAAQVTTVKSRGFTLVAPNWYGPDVQPQHRSMLLWQAQCEKQGLPFVVGLDKGSWKGMPKGGDPTAYGISMMKFMAQNFFSSPAYFKHSDGRFLLLCWDCAAVPGIDCAKVFGSIPNVAVLHSGPDGFNKPGSAGAFAWVGLPDPIAYQKTFFAAAANHPKAIVIGSVVKGFDDHGRRGSLDPTKSCWNQAQDYRFVNEREGQLFLDSVALLNQYDPEYALLPTWNDYEENTATERGIDSQLTVSLAVAKGVLTATLDGNLNTVSAIAIDVNGHAVAGSTAAPTLTFDLASLSPANGDVFNCQAVAVGKALFQNKVSNIVSTTATVIPPQTKTIQWSGSFDVPLPATVSVAVDASVGPLHISGPLDVPLPEKTHSVAVQNQPVQVNITEQMVVWE
jgi:hypothetical protein